MHSQHGAGQALSDSSVKNERENEWPELCAHLHNHVYTGVCILDVHVCNMQLSVCMHMHAYAGSYVCMGISVYTQINKYMKGYTGIVIG